MSKLKLTLFILYSALLAGGVFSLAEYIRADHGGHVITDKTPVESNIINKDPYRMTLEELQSDADCLYTGFPDIDIQSVGKDDYMLSASLCDRKWQRLVNIRPRDSPKNIVFGGVFLDSRLRTGAWGQYYRLYGNIGFGGGVSLCRDYTIVQGGVALVW